MIRHGFFWTDWPSSIPVAEFDNNDLISKENILRTNGSTLHHELAGRVYGALYHIQIALDWRLSALLLPLDIPRHLVTQPVRQQ